MEKAVINITGVIGGKELGIEGVKSFGYTDLLVQLAKTPEAKAFDFIIDTDGGSVSEGFRIAEVIESLENTRTIAKKVYSIGNVIYFAGQTRLISDEAEAETFMLHQAAMQGNKVGEMMLNPDQLRELASDLEDTTSYIAAYIASRSGIGVTKLVALMGVDRYINASDAVALGFLGSRKNSSVNIQNMANKVEAAFSNLIAKARKLLGNAANMAVTLKGGAGEIWIETEDGIVVGKKAYSTEGGDPLPDGMYEIEDGRTLDVKDGVVQSETEDAGAFPEIEVEVGNQAKQLAEALDKIAVLETELMKSKSTMDVISEERNLANEQLKAMNIVLHNVGRVTSKPLPKIEGSANLGGYTEKKPMQLTTAQQLAEVEKVRKAYSKQ